MSDIHFFTNSNNLKIAFIARKQSNSKPLEKINSLSVVFLSGYRSDMKGTKATFLANLAEENNFNYLRFDYSGHGQSDGDFKELTLSHWINDAHQAIEHNFSPNQPLILVGSSMGAWIGLKLLSRLKNPVTNFIGLAPAPDFSKILMHEQRQDPYFKQQLQEKGFVQAPCDYEGEDFIITEKFLQDADNHSILDKPIHYNGKVHILQGMQDKDVPFQHTFRLVDALTSNNVELTLIKNADHRLSEPDNLKLLQDIILNI